MSFGRLLYLGWHAPREWLTRQYDARSKARWEAAMQLSAQQLPPPQGRLRDDLPPVRFLTGARFAHQTAFCAASFCAQSGYVPPFEFHDDGSLSHANSCLLRRLFPHSRLIATSLEGDPLPQLPAARYPALRYARAASPLMRKLLDLKISSRGPSLYLDSDMLFFQPPEELLSWMEAPGAPLHMAEIDNSAYVEEVAVLDSLWATRLPRGVNSGLVAMNDYDINWDALELAATKLGPARLSHKWAEQTLFAWLLGQLNAQPVDPSRYRVCASRADLHGPLPVLRHYVHKSKFPYVASEWRKVQLTQSIRS